MLEEECPFADAVCDDSVVVPEFDKRRAIFVHVQYFQGVQTIWRGVRLRRLSKVVSSAVPTMGRLWS